MKQQVIINGRSFFYKGFHNGYFLFCKNSSFQVLGIMQYDKDGIIEMIEKGFLSIDQIKNQFLFDLIKN